MELKEKSIGTHSGVFHADEVLATMMLVNFTKEFKNSKIIRSRDKSVLEKLDILVDVGAEYNPSTHRYDHHQKGFNETYSENHKTKLSSAGLIYKHFKTEIIKGVVEYIFEVKKTIDRKYKIELTDDHLKSFGDRLYADFFESIDAVDNGISQYPIDVKPRYKNNYSDFCSRVGRLNGNRFIEDKLSQDDLFEKAMEIALDELVYQTQYIYVDDYLSFPIVKKAIENRSSFHSSGKIVFLEKGGNWKAALFKLEEHFKIKDEILFVVFKEESDNTFRGVAVPKTPSSFELRNPFHKDFCGLRDQELQKISNTKTSIFCHSAGFIAGSYEMEDLMGLIEKSLI